MYFRFAKSTVGTDFHLQSPSANFPDFCAKTLQNFCQLPKIVARGATLLLLLASFLLGGTTSATLTMNLITLAYPCFYSIS